MLFEAALQALQNFASADLWVWMLGGVIVGITFGIIPGIGAANALALFLPFVFLLKPIEAFPFMMGVASATMSGGTITTVLLGVPGVPGDAATLLDGYPMSKKGEAGRALGIALMSALVGSTLTAFMAMALIPAILPVTMNIFHAEMVVIIALGLTFIAAMSGGSMTKGLLSGVIGMLIALIGFQPSTGVDRFTFGYPYLYDGIPLIPVTLGLFAVPSMIDLVTGGSAGAHTATKIEGMRQVWRGAREVFYHKITILRSMIVAFIAGVTPGVGGSIAGFISYAQAKQSSKHPEDFGTGTAEGIVAPQCAANGEAGGALLTTLALGLPGNPAQALLLAAFIMVGLVPGPEMLTKHLDLSFTLLYVMLAGGMIATIICLPLAPYMAKVAYIPGRILAPLVLVIVFVGTYVYQEKIEDVVILLLCSALGIVTARYGYSAPSIFLGYILGQMFENYLFISLGLSGPLFFMRPISLTLIVLIVAYFSYKPLKKAFRRGRAAT